MLDLKSNVLRISCLVNEFQSYFLILLVNPRRCMLDPFEKLKAFEPKHDFFVGIDSDGCAFDTMGIKQRECFTPWMIGYFGLQPVAETARECKMFADLFSNTRGANRHKTIHRILTELLPNHPHVKHLGFDVPQFPHYFAWVEDEDSLLSNDGLKKAIETAKDEEARKELTHVLEWSERVNWSVGQIVKGIPPFPYVRESLQRLEGKADVIVVSATPQEALQREWAEHGLAEHVALIAGQEMGKKSEHLSMTAKGKYPKDHILMIGDAPGDHKAARSVDALFFPVNPGHEEESWKRFDEEALDRFFNGTYAGEYADEIRFEFEKLLPSKPPW
jgi:phosphoglycolate phosphatase-like HAD superfamily hydrolase